jgi:hypothetical protein
MASRLHPGDYITNGASIEMSLATQATITGTSVVVITHISENQIQPSVGFRIFQDMNGNVEYLRMCKDATTSVTQQAVVVGDTKIYVKDASVLPLGQTETVSTLALCSYRRQSVLPTGKSTQQTTILLNYAEEHWALQLCSALHQATW